MISVEEIALVLIHVGFTPEQVYYKMGMAEFNYHFLTAITLIKRMQQLQAATLMGTVGSFFVKKGEKTIIETLQDDIEELKGISKSVEEIRKDQIKKGQQAVNNILAGMRGLSGIGSVQVAKRVNPMK